MIKDAHIPINDLCHTLIIGFARPAQVHFRNKLRDVPSLRLFLPVYERVGTLVLTRSNALEVTSLSDICHILIIGFPKPEMTAFQISSQLTASVTTLIFQRFISKRFVSHLDNRVRSTSSSLLQTNLQLITSATALFFQHY